MKDLFHDQPNYWLLHSIKQKLSEWWFIEFHKDNEETVLTQAIEAAIEDVEHVQGIYE